MFVFKGLVSRIYDCFFPAQRCPSGGPVSYCLILMWFCMKASMGGIPFLVSPERLLHFTPAAPCSETHQWLSGNDASYWERSSFPGATIFSKTAFILNWLDTVFLACLIWHNYDLKQSVKEWRRAPAPAVGAAARVCFPEVAAKEGATIPGLESFPIAVTAHWLQNGLHMWLWDLWFCIFLSHLEKYSSFYQ